MNSPQRVLMLATAFLLVAACNKGIHLNEGSSLSGESHTLNTETGVGTGLGTVGGTTWEAVKQSMDGQIKGSSFDGQLGLQIDMANQALILLLPVPFPSLLIPVSAFDIPQLPGAKVAQVETADGGSSIAVSIPLKYILRGTNLGPYNTLPNGDLLPGMPTGGNLGFTIAFPETPDIKLNLYISANAAAAFIEIPALKLPDEWLKMSLGFKIRNASATQEVGYMAFVPNKSTYNAGVYVAARLPPVVAGVIDDLLR